MIKGEKKERGHSLYLGERERNFENPALKDSEDGDGGNCQFVPATTMTDIPERGRVLYRLRLY